MVDIEKILSHLPFDIIEYISSFFDAKELYLSLGDDSELKKVIEKKHKTYVYREDGFETFLFGLLHSFDDKPSLITSISYHWHKLGKLHRKGEPAYVMCGLKMWFIDDILERGDLPCIEGVNYKEWRINGKRGRKNDLPAIETSKGYQWFKNGVRHRDNDKLSIFFPGKYIAKHIEGKKIYDELLDPNFRMSGMIKLLL